jgi:mono/diheme cytochrome c family protein
MKNLFFKRIFIMTILSVAIGFIGCDSGTPEATTAQTKAAAETIVKVASAPVVADEPSQKKPETETEPKQPVRWKPEPTPPPKPTAAVIAITTKRLTFVEKYGLPAKYKGLKNPLAPTTENLTAGGVLFRTRCALCHGNKGKGDGVAGAALKPPATDLSRVAATALATDAYLFWTVTEGGGKLNTAMPTFNIMPEEERWQIILFVRKEITNK